MDPEKANEASLFIRRGRSDKAASDPPDQDNARDDIFRLSPTYESFRKAMPLNDTE